MLAQTQASTYALLLQAVVTFDTLFKFIGMTKPLCLFPSLPFAGKCVQHIYLQTLLYISKKPRFPSIDRVKYGKNQTNPQRK